MVKKRILIAGMFHFPYGTAPASRIRMFADGFVKNNCKVDIMALCPPPNEKRNIEEWYTLEDDIRYSYMLSEQSHNDSLIKKINWTLNNFKLGNNLYKLAKEVNTNEAYDLVLLYGRNYSYLKPITNYFYSQGINIFTDVVELPKLKDWSQLSINPIDYDQKIGFNYLVKKSTYLTTITTYLSDYIRAKEKSIVLPSIQSWAIERPELPLKNDEQKALKIVYVGNLIIRDNPIGMLNFIRELSVHLKLELILVGRFRKNKSARSIIEIIEKDEELKKVVNLRGEVTEEEKEEIFSLADAFIMPRRDHIDEIASFPTRLIEFLKTQKPVFANKIGDIPHYLTKDELIYIEDYTIQEIVKICENKPKLRSIGINGYNKGKLSFNNYIHCKKVLNLLKK